MEDLIIGETNVTERLRGKYSKLNSGWITLLDIPIEHSLKVNIESLKIMQELSYDGIYITLSKPAIELVSIFEKNNIDVKRIYFIDGISQMYFSKQLEKRAEYILGPLEINAVTPLICKILPKLKEGKQFVFLDSITTVLLYNSLSRTMEFSSFLTNTLRESKVVGMVVSVSKGLTNEKLFKELEKVSDEVVKF